MHTVSVSELQHNLISYLEKARDGDEIIIEDQNEVIARILPADVRDEESRLVAAGLMSLPKKELTEDLWKADAPDIPLEKIVEAIRRERDED